MLAGIIVFGLNRLSAQSYSDYQYLNPIPNSNYVSVDSKIIIRQGSKIENTTLSAGLIQVIGTKSGIHGGNLVLAEDSKTIVFTPSEPFAVNEDVKVIFKGGIQTNDGTQLNGLTFQFHTCGNLNNNQSESADAYFNPKSYPHRSLSVEDTSLPADLPPVIIDQSHNPSPGYMFLCPSPYLMIIDNQGTPVFYRDVQGEIYDFDLQPNGELTYFIYPVSCFGMDSSLNINRTFNTADGFTPDVHELRVLPNGNYFIFGKRNVTMDMSTIVEGGSTNADIIDGALQEFDSTGNLIFEWDALDHYKITDVDSELDLTQPTIDFSHFNSMEFDSDGNLLISARNLDEITKVDLKTGNIIWRLGGKNNQFTFINDNLGFSRQHDIRRFSNGDISLFDNGVYHPEQISSALEYKLDEVNKTATLIYRISHDNIFTDTEGSVEELPNGNRFISWGHSYDPVVTEVTQSDSVVYDLSYLEYYDTYRAFKYNWQTNLFTTNIDSVNFGKVIVGDSLTKQITVFNPHDSAVTINEFYCTNPSFSTSIKVPVTIQPNDSIVVPLLFKPERNGTFTASFNIRNIGDYNGFQQMIARQVILSGTSDNVSAINQGAKLPGEFSLSQNYPNPFNPSTTIEYSLPEESHVRIEIFNSIGQKIATVVNADKNAGSHQINWSANNLSSGIYFYSITTNSNSGKNYFSVRKMILLK